jgi:ribonucleoside-diphosphate reductase beta chain
MLFEEQIARKPNLYPWTQEFIDRMWAGFWTPNEFDFKSDYNQFKKEMTEEKKRMIVKTLSAIGQVEIAVKRYWAQLGDRFPHPSMSDLGYVMANSEVIHNQAYEKLLEKLNLGKAFEENLQEPTLQGRVTYLRKYLARAFEDDKQQQIYALILFTLFVENVSLFSQFYIVLHENTFHNILKDTAQQVQYTKNEEMLHAQVGIRLINTLREEYPEEFTVELYEKIMDEVNSAIEAETKIIEWMLAGVPEEEHLSVPILREFIKKRLYDSLKQIGYTPIMQLDNELLEKTVWFDETVLGNAMTDFFHARPIEYSKKNKVFDSEDLF